MTHHTEAELMPCPFCGSEHVIMEQYKADGLRIICKNCAVKREQRTMRKSLDWLRAGMISDWNRCAPAAPVPQWWKLVPVEPTKEMLSQFDELFLNGRISSSGEFLVSVPSHDCNIQVDSCAAKEVYGHMIAAAPTPPEKDNS